jgi:hypothetical protein
MIEERKIIILDILDGSSSRLRESFFDKNHGELVTSINEFCSNIEDISFKEKLWYWISDINRKFLCCCGNTTTFNKNWLDGYRKYCSPKCAQSDKSTKEKRIKTNLEKYGVTNVAKSDLVKKKIEDTNLERYGHKSSFQNDDVKKKWADNINSKYGVSHISQLESVKNKRINTNLEKYGVEHYTQTDEYKEKTLSTNLEKYGVGYYTQTDEYKEKTLNTNLEKWGVTHYSKTNEFKERISKTNKEKYGSDFYYQSEDFKEKSSKTNIERYGVRYYAQTDEYNNRIKIINNLKYGVDWYYQSNNFKEKSLGTNLERYGVEHHSKSSLFKDKVVNTSRERYGVENYSKTMESKQKTISKNFENFGVDNIQWSELFRKNKYGIANNTNYIEYISDSNSLFLCDCQKDHKFIIDVDNYIKRSKTGNPICTVCYPIGDNKSIMEKELLNYITGIYDGEVISGYRDDLEIDIYLPDMSIGFEFNGLYWHSSEYKDKNYHINKTNFFRSKDIRIIHIWEDDWVIRRDIIESQISNMLNKTSTTIYARKCTVIEVDSKTAISFLEKNHIQGKVNSCLKLGLVYNNQLVSLMTFDHFEGRKKMLETDWNINRFCNSINTTVVGGASKLFSYFIRRYKPKRVISYADRDWSVGDLYYKLGFERVSESLPDYKYVISGSRVHKSRYKKSKIKTELTESQYASENNILRVYDCGKIKFEKIFSSN